MFEDGDPDLQLDDARREVLLRHARAIAAGADPDTPLTAAHAFRPPADMTPTQGLGLLAAMALVILSGFVSGRAAAWLGVRWFALLLLAVAGSAVFGLRGARDLPGARGLAGAGGADGPALPAAERALLIFVLAAAVLTGSPTALLLLPAIVHAAVAHLMFASMNEKVSLIEMGARVSHPLAPAFVGPYCRRLTAVWGFAFAMSAGITAVFALSGHVALHHAWTGWMFWSLLGAFSIAEFFFRKAWFRYFGKGPFDRFLAELFPPENTERGRRSEAYLQRMRAELARLAEIERAAQRG